MRYRPLDALMVRAPLVPVSGAQPSDRELVDAAFALADSPGARDAYLRRAAFRATPHGLWAGVAMGRLGARTRIDTGRPRASVTVSWGRLAALGRALLDEPAWRERASLRVAPSLSREHGGVGWLAWGEAARAERRAAACDELLERTLAAAAEWTAWPAVRAEAAAGGADADALDDYLLALIDDGLLHHDLEPPLVGPPPLEWMARRVAGELPPLAAVVGRLARDRLAAAEVRDVRAQLATLPGESDQPALHAVLVHQPPSPPSIARAPVERAAALAPLLWRLQDALAPPAAERALDPHIDEALDGVTEIFGAGALDLGPLARGEYGTSLGDGRGDDEPRRAAAPALVAYLAELAVRGAATGEVELDPQRLDELLPEIALPPTCELTLQPARAASDWLLGLHAPAGASWGRFAHALGAPLAQALGELARAEAEARPGEERLDVAFAPSRAHADLAAHPPVRRRALALSGWPAGAAVLPGDLALCADPAAPEPLALRAGEEPVAPSPLARLRSTTAPAGLDQLLVGWSLWRQHAPWAFGWGPLADLPCLPRVRLGGFVVAPASFRLPERLDSAAALARWRAEAGVPRHLQVGHEDVLAWVDLEARTARAELARLARDAPRAYEVWPPIGDEVDRAGRRVEVVVALVAAATPEAASAIAVTRRSGRVAPPSASLPDERFHTYKIFGAAERSDRVLVEAILPAVEASAAAGEIDRWFFLRYVDGPGRREHLRLRARDRRPGAFARRLAAALRPARAAGDVVSVETAEYHRELARYGADAIDAVERVFEADSQLVGALVGCEPADGEDALERLVASYDALARGAGLDVAARRAVAVARRDAYGVDRRPGPLADDFRLRQRRLQARLGEPASPYTEHTARVAAALAPLALERRVALLAPLLHLAAVRLVGTAREDELAAVYFWERTLEGLERRAQAR